MCRVVGPTVWFGYRLRRDGSGTVNRCKISGSMSNMDERHRHSIGQMRYRRR